jgi:hypothetical protein
MTFAPLISLFFSTIITTYYRGFFSYSGFALVLCLFFLLCIYFFKKKSSHPRENLRPFLAFLLIATYTLFLFNNAGIYQTEIIPSVFLEALPIFFLPLIISYLFDDDHVDSKSKIKRFWLLFILAIVLRFLMIFASPKPVIDVYTVLKEAPLSLLQGKNPYDISYSQVYPGAPNDSYSYWPLSFLLQIPFVTIFNDPRILLAAADILSGLFLYLLGKRKTAAELLTLIYLFRPNSNFILEQSWLVNLEFLFLILSFYALTKKAHLLAGIFLGCLIAVKPHYFPVIPFILVSFEKTKKLFVGLAATLIIFVCPFLFWNAPVFLQKTIGGFFLPNNKLWWIPYSYAMSANVLYSKLTKNNIPFIFSIVILISLFLSLIYILGKRKMEIKNGSFHSHVLLAITIFYLAFNILFRFSFINQYYFIGSCIILWMAL